MFLQFIYASVRKRARRRRREILEAMYTYGKLEAEINGSVGIEKPELFSLLHRARVSAFNRGLKAARR